MHEPSAPGGRAVVLDVAQLEALLTRTFSIGLDAGRGREKVALDSRSRTRAMAAGALAIERGVATEQIAAAKLAGTDISAVIADYDLATDPTCS